MVNKKDNSFYNFIGMFIIIIIIFVIIYSAYLNNGLFGFSYTAIITFFILIASLLLLFSFFSLANGGSKTSKDFPTGLITALIGMAIFILIVLLYYLENV